MCYCCVRRGGEKSWVCWVLRETSRDEVVLTLVGMVAWLPSKLYQGLDIACDLFRVRFCCNS